MVRSPFGPGVNFINILQAAFTCKDPEGAKKTGKLLKVFFVHSGFALVKDALRMLMKLTPDPESAKKTIKL